MALRARQPFRVPVWCAGRFTWRASLDRRVPIRCALFLASAGPPPTARGRIGHPGSTRAHSGRNPNRTARAERGDPAQHIPSTATRRSTRRTRSGNTRAPCVHGTPPETWTKADHDARTTEANAVGTKTTTPPSPLVYVGGEEGDSNRADKGPFTPRGACRLQRKVLPKRDPLLVDFRPHGKSS